MNFANVDKKANLHKFQGRIVVMCCVLISGVVNPNGLVGSLVWKAWDPPAPHTPYGQLRDLSKGRRKCIKKITKGWALWRRKCITK